MEIFKTDFLVRITYSVTKKLTILLPPSLCLQVRVSLRAFGREPSAWIVQREEDTKKVSFYISLCVIFVQFFRKKKINKIK